MRRPRPRNRHVPRVNNIYLCIAVNNGCILRQIVIPRSRSRSLNPLRVFRPVRSREIFRFAQKLVYQCGFSVINMCTIAIFLRLSLSHLGLDSSFQCPIPLLLCYYITFVPSTSLPDRLLNHHDVLHCRQTLFKTYRSAKRRTAAWRAQFVRGGM